MARRRRPDHATDMTERFDGRRLRARRRRRRALRGVVRLVFWTFVLSGVFVLGLGYGKTLGGDEQSARERVEVTQDLGPVEATLPTRTITQTRTVTVRARAGGRAAANR